MFIVKYNSGIGNQLYQYALHFALEKHYPNTKVLADLTAFEDDEILNKGNGFEYGFGIEKFFNIELDKASKQDALALSCEAYFGKVFRRVFPKFAKRCSGFSFLARCRAELFPKYKKKINNYMTNIPYDSYNGNIWSLDINQEYYFSGLWQNIKYFEDVETELKKKLEFCINLEPSKQIVLDKIMSSESVCIHVRRGNFTDDRNKFSHDLCNRSYYLKAINMIKEETPNCEFFVFSDDIGYCKNLFLGMDNITYVSDGNESRSDVDMYLISRCKAAIIPNSTFAFWSVYITDNGNKKVICPKYSVRGKNCWHEFSVPKHWVKINNLAS